MIKKHPIKTIISEVLTLSPILFGLIVWNKLPDSMFIHFGADGVADGIGSKAFAVFVIPIILAFFNIGGLLLTSIDKRQAEQNEKALGIVFWIIPSISIIVNGMLYSVALGNPFNAIVFLPIILGTTFIIIGNYMPKIKQNYTLGIKIGLTFANEENWNKTHRFSGKVWVIGGFAILFASLLPAKALIPVTLCAILFLVMTPVIYSFIIYRQHRKDGIEYSFSPKTKFEKTGILITATLIPAILIFLAIIMFTGNITSELTDTELNINSTYMSAVSVKYDEIDSVELTRVESVGYKTFGYNSPRLSLGSFRNDLYGDYTCYLYNSNSTAIKVTSGSKILLLNCESAEQTQTLYEKLLEKCK